MYNCIVLMMPIFSCKRTMQIKPDMCRVGVELGLWLLPYNSAMPDFQLTLA